jgi:translin
LAPDPAIGAHAVPEPLRDQLAAHVESVTADLQGAHRAREVGLAACRRVIRASGSSIRAVHRLRPDDAAALARDAEVALREAQDALGPFPSVVHAGFLSDAEKEYAEARATAALISGGVLPGPSELGVMGTSWLKGIAEAASELRRHALDRLRAGQLDEGQALLAAMDDVYDVLVTVDFPDALTGGLRRTVDAYRAVLERTRGDITTTVLQERLRVALQAAAGP